LALVRLSQICKKMLKKLLRIKLKLGKSM
jgi:hypothetical protein